MMPERTHYEVLGVAAGATAEQIRRAYRTAAKAHHPDVSAGEGAHGRFSRVAAAYAVLSDRSRRAEYDLSLKGPSRRKKGERGAEANGQAHYTWTNIATEEARSSAGVTEFDEMYETFFMPHKPAE